MTQEELDRKTYELQVQNLNNFDTQIKAAANILGYKKLPPTIEQFLTDPYYMGEICKNLYPFWVDKLKQIYPTCIHTAHPIVVVKGGIGTGKSTFARIMAMYTLCRLFHLRNPHDTFKMVPGKFIDFNFFSYTSGLADSEFLAVIDEWMGMSPYFQEMREKEKLNGITLTSDGPRGNNAISKDIIFYNLSELNFISYEKAFEKLNSALKRWDSRFGRFKDYFGHLIVDTSSRGDDSIADEFANSNPYENVLVINTNQWVVREHLGYYGQKGWFKVYCGDAIHQPFIVSDDKPITPEMDMDRVIDVPEEVRADFQYDLITALQDKAGISTNTSDRFFPDTTNVMKCFDQPMYSEDVIKVDFFNKTDKLIYKLDRYIRAIPDDKIIYIRYDLGTVSDNTGLAICYFDKWRIYDADKKIRQPELVLPLAVGINRYDGQETPIYHLFEFIMDLNERFEIGQFTADQYASKQLLQDLTREGVPNGYLSVDRTDEAHIYFKTLSNNCLLHMPHNKLLITETCDLRRVGNKIDHPSTGSKDISDAVVGAVFSCYLDIDHAGQLSNKYKLSTHADLIKERSQDPNDRFQEMVGNLY